ncbi:MAG: GAF domain-containing protein [Steroidobacteraceae bacterium]
MTKKGLFQMMANIGSGAPESIREGLLRTLARVLDMTASREPLTTVLGEQLRSAEELMPEMRCCFLLADPTAGVLRFAAAPRLPSAYSQALDRLRIADGIASCGTAAARLEPVLVDDISRSPLWRGHADLATSYGLAACWSVPLMDDRGELLGTCAVYYMQPRGPTAAEEYLIRATANIAAMVIQRHRDAQRLQFSEARYGRLADLCPDAVIVHCDGVVTHANRAAAELLHRTGPDEMVSQSLEKLTGDECEYDIMGHRAGVLAARLSLTNGRNMDVEITASQLPMDGQMMTLMVGRDVTEQRKMQNEILEMASRERAQLAYDLHDGLGQQLTGIGLCIRGLGSEIARHLPAYTREFEKINSLVAQSINDTRRLARGMSPIAVERDGLSGALTALAAHAREIYRLRVHLDINPLSRMAIKNGVASDIYRIVQEATTNVARHAHATSLRIAVRIEKSLLVVTVADDGIGMSDSQRSTERAGSLGLRIMKYRAERIGGTFRIDRRVPHGTAIQVSYPLGKFEHHRRPASEEEAISPMGTAGEDGAIS